MRVIVNIPQGPREGSVYRNVRSGRLEWFSPGRGKWTYPKDFTLEDVKAHIAKLCRVNPSDVIFKEWKV